ncbi:MAG: DUF86 domain-containing protein [Spirochaetales bacterium]|nr:DUF86 domain-containing protein [Spirochaetales bacterium]
MIDKDIILKHLHELENILTILDELKNYSLKEIKSDIKKAWEIEHGLQLAIQNLLDVSSHLLSALGKNNCDSYTDIILTLGKENIIPYEFAEKIKGMAGLRNILVHEYLAVDIGVLHGLLQKSLVDFRVFGKYILGFLEQCL